MNYCPDCGDQTFLKSIPNDRLPRNVCQGCHQIHYENPKIIVGSLPILNSSVLLSKRAKHPSIGMWTIPSGFKELGESLEDGARREASEEANLTLKGLRSRYQLIILYCYGSDASSRFPKII